MVILSTSGFCLLLVHPEGRVGIWKDHRLCGQADLGLHSGSVVHYTITDKSHWAFVASLAWGSPVSCTGLWFQSSTMQLTWVVEKRAMKIC